MIQGTSARWLGPATEPQISAIEAELGHAVPLEYRQFLLAHGCGIVDGLELFGLGRVSGGLPDLGFVLGQIRTMGFHRPKGLVPFAAVGNGDYVAIPGEVIQGVAPGRVVYWRPARAGAGEVEDTCGGLVDWVEKHRRAAARSLGNAGRGAAGR